MQVAPTLGIKQIHSLSYYFWSNGCIQNVHNSLMTCIYKHFSSQLSCDEKAHITCASYNFVPNEHSKEGTFFPIFGRDAYTPLMQLLNPKVRYIIDDRSFLALHVLRETYALPIILSCLKDNSWPCFWQTLYLNFMLETQYKLEIM